MVQKLHMEREERDALERKQHEATAVAWAREQQKLVSSMEAAASTREVELTREKERAEEALQESHKVYGLG